MREWLSQPVSVIDVLGMFVAYAAGTVIYSVIHARRGKR